MNNTVQGQPRLAHHGLNARATGVAADVSPTRSPGFNTGRKVEPAPYGPALESESSYYWRRI